jgi:hypothetical protein
MDHRIQLSLQPSEAVVARAAASIYAAYIMAGRVPSGHEAEWMERSVREALQIAQLTDDLSVSDSEMQ